MTAYEMRISDWSSDVCSSDLAIVGEQYPFKVAGKNIEPAGNYHVLRPVHQGQEPILVDPPDVAVAIEESSLCIVPVHRPGRVGAVVIAGHHRRAAADDLSARDLRQFRAVLADHFGDMAGRGLADGVELVRRSEEHTSELQ